MSREDQVVCRLSLSLCQKISPAIGKSVFLMLVFVVKAWMSRLCSPVDLRALRARVWIRRDSSFCRGRCSL